jgi:hypothetical protein
VERRQACHEVSAKLPILPAWKKLNFNSRPFIHLKVIRYGSF